MVSFFVGCVFGCLVSGFVIYHGSVYHNLLPQGKRIAQNQHKKRPIEKGFRYTITINNCYIYTTGISQYQTTFGALTELMYSENGFQYAIF